MKWLHIVLILSFFQQLLGQTPQKQVQKLNFSQFEPYLHKQNDTLYVINFWASWCVPCIDELPAFEKIREKYSDQKMKILLVSLDFPSQLESRLLPFIKKHKLQSDVILLDDPQQNQWINKVDPKWSGTIPFTQIYKNDLRESFEHKFNYTELDSLIHIKLNLP